MSAETEARGRSRGGVVEEAKRKDLPLDKALKRASFGQRLRRDRVLLMLCIPGLAFFLLFHYLPLLGYVVAFQNYQPFLGFGGSPWVGLSNFAAVFTDATFWQAAINTVKITTIQLVLSFPAPICLALLLNSLTGTRFKRFVQSVVYLPHFIGWVIIISIAQEVLGGTGPVSAILSSLGFHDTNVMTNGAFFPFLVTFELIWKTAGWGTIIYLAAMASIDTELYEAAAADGAGRWQRTWHVTLPGILPVTILLLILNLGTILSVGFEQILLQRDNVGPQAGEVLDTYVYFHGIVDGQWGTSAAVGLVKGIIGLILVLSANRIAHLLGQDGIYQSRKK